jgi:PAS domain S-box-containing protein
MTVRHRDQSDQGQTGLADTETQTATGSVDSAAWNEAEELGRFGTFEFAHPTSDVIASAGLLRLLGFDPDQGPPTMEQVWQRFTPESREVAQRALVAAWEQAKPQKEELVIQLPDGRQRMVLAQARAVTDEQGQPTAILGYCHDVTEQRQLEQALRVSERKYRSLLDSSTQFLLVVQDGCVVYINPHAARSLGYSVESLSNRSFLDFVHPEDRQLAGEMYQRRLSGQPVPDRYELRVVKSSGETACCEISGVPFEWDGRPASLIFATDITERRRAEQALRDSTRRYRELFEGSRDGFVVVDSQGQFVDANEAYCQMLGYTLEELQRKGGFHAVTPERWRQWEYEEIWCNRLLQTGSSGVYEKEYIRKDGTIVPVELQSFTVRDEQGDVCYLWGVVRDITDRKQTEKALQESERHFMDVLYASSDAILLIGENRFVDCNEATARMLGYVTREEFLQTHPSELSPPEQPDGRSSYEKADEMMHLAYERGFHRFEWIHRRANGEDFPVEVSLTPIVHGGNRLLHCVWRDITRRKQTEEALQTSEREKRMILDATSEMFAYYDPEMNILWANRAAADSVGGTVEDLLGRKCYEVWHNRSEPCPDCPLTTALQTGEQGQGEVRTPDGQWWLIRGYPVLDETGKVTRLIEFGQNITDRKRAEEALRESEGRVRAKLDAILMPEGDLGSLELADVIDAAEIQELMEDFHALTDIGVAIVDLKGQVLVATGWQDICTKYHRVHPETCRNCIESDLLLSAGVDSGQFKVYKCKNNMWDISTPITVGDHHVGNLFLGQFLFEDEELDRELFRTQARRYGFDEAEYLAALERVPRWSRETVDRVMTFYSRFATMVSRLSYSSLKLARSLEEGKRMEQALMESEERFEMAMRGSSDGFWDWPDVSDASYVWWSPRMFELTGYEPGEFQPSFEFWVEAIHLEDRDTANQTVQKVLDGGNLFDIQYRMRTKCGSYRWFRARAVVVRDEDGKPRRMSGSLIDITEMKRLQELESRAQRLETAGSIAGQVAHDFNNLLAPLTAYPDLIKEYLSPDHPAWSFVEDMEQAAQQIAEINQQLLTLGRRGHYQLEPLIVNEVVEQVVRQMTPLPEALHVELNLAEDLLHIKAGRSQIYRALTNLINNAREAMQDVGRLTITTENFYFDDMVVNYGSIPRGEYVKMTVTDTGCGIPEKIRSRIFDAFFTTKVADKKRGSGLGVSVVDAVVRDHQGYIDLASVEGEGTSFYLYFPVTREAPAPDEKTDVVGGSESILVVDDDRVQRDVSRELLTRLGYRVTVAESGEEALRLIGSQSADLILLDMIMPPGIDGAETYRRILEISPGQRALLVSGYAESSRVELALQLGAAAFVRKPLPRKSLAAAVRSALDRKRV